MEMIFASKAQPGERYLTHTGAPLQVVGPKGSQIEVQSLSTGNRIMLDAGTLLQPYDGTKLNREAVLLMRKTGVVKTEIPQARLDEVEGKRQVVAMYKGDKYVAIVHNAQDKKGFMYDGKLYRSLTDVARTITGQKIINGPKFFGLREKAGK
jgi:hypothetical protein